jgi:hypothetical protein
MMRFSAMIEPVITGSSTQLPPATARNSQRASLTIS